MTDIISDLGEQWDALMAAGNATDADSFDIFEDIIYAYGQSHRFYHTIEHLDALFSRAETLEFDDPVSIKMAIFYHDFVYETDPVSLQAMQQGTRAGNEERSALRAIEDMTRLGFPAETIDRTARMIRLTATHQLQMTDSRDAALFLDMDMAILGARPEHYDLYANQVYCEYQQMGPQAVTGARLAFIAATLKSPRIFHTYGFKVSSETKARINLNRERISLQSGNGMSILQQLFVPAPPKPGIP